jgi:hypothetical protein
VVGHKAAERRGIRNVEEPQKQNEAAVEEVSMGGGLWMIGAVHTECKKVEKRVMAKRVQGAVRK